MPQGSVYFPQENPKDASLSNGILMIQCRTDENWASFKKICRPKHRLCVQFCHEVVNVMRFKTNIFSIYLHTMYLLCIVTLNAQNKSAEFKRKLVWDVSDVNPLRSECWRLMLYLTNMSNFPPNRGNATQELLTPRSALALAWMI